MSSSLSDHRISDSHLSGICRKPVLSSYGLFYTSTKYSDCFGPSHPLAVDHHSFHNPILQQPQALSFLNHLCQGWPVCLNTPGTHGSSVSKWQLASYGPSCISTKPSSGFPASHYSAAIHRFYHNPTLKPGQDSEQPSHSHRLLLSARHNKGSNDYEVSCSI